MPKIKLDHVISCSSEDPDYIANNLLNNETKKKWRNKNVGETSASVILQLDKSCKISGIDIGNENSSFIEVLVGRSSSREQDYKLILPMSSFMTPMEARNLTNNNRVRMFTYNDLASDTRDEKWDRIKVVCTQPFNKHTQYGLSFITLHSSQEQKDDISTIGKFTLRPNSPNILAAGSVFAKKKEFIDSKLEDKTVAQAIKSSDTPKRESTKTQISINVKASSSRDSEQKNRNRKALFYNTDEEAADEKIDQAINKIKEVTEKKESKTKNESPKPKHTTKKNIQNANETINTPNSTKRKVDTIEKIQRKKPKIIKKPFLKLLEGVVFSISGLVNPERANLRTLGLSMGAKYKADWDDSCSTHLICAFANTPKFNQVKGKGKIVTKMWIKDCFDQRKRLPWRRYAIDRNDQGQPESEDEIEEQKSDDDDDDDLSVSNKNNYSSASDTDNEIEKILTKEKKQTWKEDVHDIETEEEEFNKNPVDLNLDDIPKVFNSEVFFIDDIFDEKEKHTLQRLIKAFDGTILTSLRNIVDFVVTNQNSSALIKEKCPNVKCVTCKWIYECHNTLKRAPYEQFLLK